MATLNKKIKDLKDAIVLKINSLHDLTVNTINLNDVTQNGNHSIRNIEIGDQNGLYSEFSATGCDVNSDDASVSYKVDGIDVSRNSQLGRLLFPWISVHNRYFALSVNGIFADAKGNVELSAQSEGPDIRLFTTTGGTINSINGNELVVIHNRKVQQSLVVNFNFSESEVGKKVKIVNTIGDPTTSTVPSLGSVTKIYKIVLEGFSILPPEEKLSEGQWLEGVVMRNSAANYQYILMTSRGKLA